MEYIDTAILIFFLGCIIGFCTCVFIIHRKIKHCCELGIGYRIGKTYYNIRIYKVIE